MEKESNLNIEISTFQKVAEQEIEQLRKENFSFKIIIAQLYLDLEKLKNENEKDKEDPKTVTEEKYI